jgi:hypothetical protein
MLPWPEEGHHSVPDTANQADNERTSIPAWGGQDVSGRVWLGGYASFKMATCQDLVLRLTHCYTSRLGSYSTIDDESYLV